MTIKYYLKPDSNTPPAYSYIESFDTDSFWNSETCIEVPRKPSESHVYNFTTESWELNEVNYMSNLRSKRNAELEATDKYVLVDYPLSTADLETIKTYRQDLRDCPNKELLADRVLPTKPSIL